jgi:hypothetical protein
MLERAWLQRVASHEEDMERWRNGRHAAAAGMLYSMCVTAGLWIVSYAAVDTVVANVRLSEWLGYLTLLTFVAAIGATGVALVLGAIAMCSPRPARPRRAVEQRFIVSTGACGGGDG